jgi:shikimate dehydrogenase
MRLKLGLIGTGIGRSRAPDLHRLAGRLCGIEVTYDLIEQQSARPAALDPALAECRSEGYRGVNVTHPFKERAAELAYVPSEQVRPLAAVNTIRFDEQAQPQGFNTDHSGFKRAFKARFLDMPPGIVAMVGAGGVGRAIAFGLIELGAKEIRLFDTDVSRSDSLATALRPHSSARIVTCKTLKQATANADGLVNATPVGMHHHPGTPIPRELIDGQSWAFEAVYTPAETRFVLDATRAGLQVLGGYELFFYQGVDAFEIFSGVRVDEVRLREGLARG